MAIGIQQSAHDPSVWLMIEVQGEMTLRDTEDTSLPDAHMQLDCTDEVRIQCTHIGHLHLGSWHAIHV